MIARRVLVLAALAALTGSAVRTTAWTEAQRLSAAPARLTYNFAWSIAADDAVHVVWYQGREGAATIHYRRSRDRGATWEPDAILSGGPAGFPAVAASGRYVYAAWHETRGGNADVVLRRSADRGATWERPIRLTSHPGNSMYASIAASGSGVYVTFFDNRDGQTEAYLTRSHDHGLTWAPEVRLSDLPYDSWTPTVAASGSKVYVAWVDLRDGNEEEYFRRSRDGGRSWGPIVRLTRDGANSWAPSIAASGEAVHVAWFDQRDSPVQPLDAERVLDEALALVRLQQEPTPAGGYAPDPREVARRRVERKLRQIEAAAPGWVQAGGDAARLQGLMAEFQRSMREATVPLGVRENTLDEALNLMGLRDAPAPGGVPVIYYLEAQRMRIEEKTQRIRAAAPEWVRRGGDPRRLEALLRRFERMMRRATTEWEIYYKRSTDGGATWSQDRRLTFAPGLSQRPSLALSGGEVHVVWFDGRDGDTEIYYTHSPDRGLTWNRDVRLTSASGASLHPSVAASRGAVHVVWFDERRGQPEIYVKRTR